MNGHTRRYFNYKFKRIIFGIKCTPEAFHKLVIQNFEGISLVESYMDDIRVWSSTLKEHNGMLKQVFIRAKKMVFNLLLMNVSLDLEKLNI